jgi:MoaA/NifB/PqqE/SkfB family radical SAM enzyme
MPAPREAELLVRRPPDFVWGFEAATFPLEVRNLGLAELARPETLGALVGHVDLHRPDGAFVRRLATSAFPEPVPLGETRSFDVVCDVKAGAGDYELRWVVERAANGSGPGPRPVDALAVPTPLRVRNTIFEMFVELINACNFRCDFCPQTTLQRKQRPMEFELATKIVRDLADMGHHHPLRCHLLGEPLLYPRFFDFVDMAHDHGQTILLATNGSRFQAKNVAGIFRTRLDRMVISLNTPEEELYNAQRGTSMPYAEYLQGIRDMVSELVRRGPPPVTRINVLYDRAKADSPEETARVRAIANDWIGVAREVSGRPLPDAEEVVHLDDEGTTLIELCDGLELQCTIYHNWGEGSPPVEHFCAFPWKQLAVLVDGQATACCVDAEGEMTLGDARTQSIAEIWNGPQINRLREGFLRSVPMTPRCARCDVRHPKAEFFPGA